MVGFGEEGVVLGDGKKIILVVLDGLGDRPCREFAGKTPLEAARTVNLDFMAKNGECGLVDPVGVGVRPGSDVAHFSLFGYDYSKEYVGRGPLEALGLGFALKKGDIALRANFGTVNEKGIIVDRRAGRIESVKELAQAITGREFHGVKMFVLPSVGHRAAVVLRGDGLSPSVCDGDPHKEGTTPITIVSTHKRVDAEKTAKVLNEFLEFAHKTLLKHEVNRQRVAQKKLPANYVLVRGAGVQGESLAFEKLHGLKPACVAGGGLYKGLARLVGMKIVEVEGATGKPDTNLNAKVKAAVDSLEFFDFIFLHFKGTDVCGEDGNAKGKKEFIERADKALAPLLKQKNLVIAVTGDHSTPCSLKRHSGDPVPILFYTEGIRTNDWVKKFGEKQCATGITGRITGKNIVPQLINLAGRAPMVGN